MRKYNIINNSLGWLCFLIAAVTYLLTIEPTASFWDCPEFITQGYKLEVGHPPGNPIFMLTARFFVTLFGGSAQSAAVAVNSMSAILSALTILLLFWTITHLAKKLIVRQNESSISPVKTLVIMAAGVCGSLAYTWSDTFWFSAVEGEVYAFSSFCTALVFWLILKWENRADNPHSDKYLILIAYVIGISIAVHLLNLLCIPAIVLVIYYRKFKNTNVVGSLIALALSAAIVALILFGLVPGFVSVAQRFELFFVNNLGMSYNMGVFVYAVITLAVFIWTIWQLRLQKSPKAIKIGTLLSVVLSGMPFIGHGWLIPTLLIAALVIYLYGFCPKIPIRIFNIVILSIFVIFIGYSSYALLLIRSTADTPMNQNSPDNVFALGSYLNREQYGDTPILYGPKVSEAISYSQGNLDGQTTEYVEVDQQGNPVLHTDIIGPRVFSETGGVVDNGKDRYAKIIKTSPDQPDRYVPGYHDPEFVIPSGMGALFPRMYSDDARNVASYKAWANYSPRIYVDAPPAVKEKWAADGFVTRQELEQYLNMDDATIVNDIVITGDRLSDYTPVWQPSFWDNMRYFFNYQLNHMYWRYFMWNFAGRQNDLQGNGEPHLGNWISGIPFIDNPRLGDQSLLPEEYSTGNAGHNVFYMLPLILGLLGLVWQALMNHPAGDKQGIEQFWVVFFLFFMTGIAIVLYLNQTPGQPRERDYAFAGSFYAFAIWIGLGVAAIFRIILNLFTKTKKQGNENTDSKPAPATQPSSKLIWGAAVVAAIIGLIVPLQMVSQTWDDHDRSGRYTTRDFGMNYLNSLDENAIIFVNGDNDTFPLWYAQEVEGCRTDVKVVNLSYLSQDWYARQVASNSYDAKGVPFYMPDSMMNYGNVQFYTFPAGMKAEGVDFASDVTAKDALTNMYKIGPQTFLEVSGRDAAPGKFFFVGGLNTNSVYVPISKENLISKFGALPTSFSNDSTSTNGKAEFRWDITPDKYLGNGYMSQFASLLTYDIIARSATEGFNRPVYFASTVGDNYYLGFTDNMYNTGMALQVTPFNRNDGDASPVAVKAYENVLGKFRWGGLDGKKKIYLDETVRRLITSTRLALLSIAQDLLATPDKPAPESARKLSKEKGLPVPSNYADMAANLLEYMSKKMPTSQAPYENGIESEIAKVYILLGELTDNPKYFNTAKEMLQKNISRTEALLRFRKALAPDLAANLMSSERRNLIYVLNAISNINYIDLRLAAINGKISKDDLTKERSSMLSDISGVNLQSLFYLQQPSVKELEEARALKETDNWDVVDEFSEIHRLFEKSGINPYDRINDFVKKTGFSLNEWDQSFNGI